MNGPTPRELAAELLPATFLTAHALAARGLTRRALTSLVRAGQLVRLRRGRYVPADTHPQLIRAGELGGRLDCVSLLAALGVFVHTGRELHLQIERGASRLPAAPADAIRHWRVSSRPSEALSADLTEAIAQAFRCQGVRAGLCTIESAWHHRLIDEEGVAAVFALLPRPYRRLRGLLDPRAESGTETIMRLMLRALGCDVAVQVRIRGVGRVDLVVDGWLIVECDSRAFHEGWAKQKDDRRRDLAAAARGYTTVRLLAEDVLYRRDVVLAHMKEVLAHGPATRTVRNSSTSGVRARRRA